MRLRKAAAADAERVSAQRAAKQRKQQAADSDARISRMWARAPKDSDEEQSDAEEGSGDESDLEEEGSDGGWGPEDSDDEEGSGEESEGEESADEDDGPSQQVSKRARVEEAPAKPPSAAEAVSRAAADAAAKQQRRAQERADGAIRQCEERREGRAEAVAARSRVAGRCIQLKAVVNNYWGRHRVPRPQRSRERLTEAPPDVLLAFDELQELEAQLQSAGS